MVKHTTDENDTDNDIIEDLKRHVEGKTESTTGLSKSLWTFDSIRNIVAFGVILVGFGVTWGGLTGRISLIEQQLEYIKNSNQQTITTLRQEISRLELEVRNLQSEIEKEIERHHGK